MNKPIKYLLGLTLLLGGVSACSSKSISEIDLQPHYPANAAKHKKNKEPEPWVKEAKEDYVTLVLCAHVSHLVGDEDNEVLYQQDAALIADSIRLPHSERTNIHVSVATIYTDYQRTASRSGFPTDEYNKAVVVECLNRRQQKAAQ